MKDEIQLIFLVAASWGGYDRRRGFTGDPARTTGAVPDPLSAVGVPPQERAERGDVRDDLSECASWKTIATHGLDVAAEAQRIFPGGGLDPKLAAVANLAGRLHDCGKAHPAFRACIRATGAMQALADLAKAPDDCWLPVNSLSQNSVRTEFECILDQLEAGTITLTTVTLLAPHLTDENHQAVLDQARHKSKREVEVLAAALRREPDVPASVRKVPQPPPAMTANVATPPTLTFDALSTAATHMGEPQTVERTPPPRPAIVKPLAPSRYVVKLTVPAHTHQKLRRAQSLLRHAVPDGDLAEVLDRALTALLRDLERAKAATTARPRATRRVRRHSRYIPAAVRREVWQRDGGCCAFIGAEGRCGETSFVDFHHCVPFADSGPATAANIELRCAAHNAHEADRWFGPMVVKEAAARYEWRQN